MELHRYWVRFKPDPSRHDIPRPGCGVTAWTFEDALVLMGATVFLEKDMPPIEEAINDVDIRTLDQGHVILNMEVPNLRGVWYPRGFAS